MTKPKNPPKTPDALSGNAADFFNAINHENDLACVLVTLNYLDQCLATLLRRFFRESPNTCDRIFDPGQTLGNFSSRTMLAYCLNLIDSAAFTNLNHIGDIRNRFAHSHPELTFQDAEVQRLCNCLKFPEFAGTHVSQDSTGATVQRPLTQQDVESQYPEPKNRFTFIASQLGMYLLIKSHTVKRCDAE